MSAGRPSDYCPDTVAQICARLTDGESLRAICRDEAMPSCATVFVWLQKHPEFTEQYTRAREAQADAMADDILEIADDGRNDWMERGGEDCPGWSVNGEHIQRSRLRVDSRKWLASKLLPKKYGDKMEQTHVGDAARPIVVSASDGKL